MKCSYCGAELPERGIFCGKCGTRQVRPAPAPEAAPVFQPALDLQPEPIPVPQAEPVFQSAPAAEVIPEETPVPMAPPVTDDQLLSWQNEEEPKFDFEKDPGYVPLPPRTAPQPAPLLTRPVIQLPTARGLAKIFFLGILTLGIYPMVIWSRIVTELNIAASRYDGERTMSYFGSIMLAPITLGIYNLVWIHKFCRRIGNELRRRNIAYEFGAKHFWLWNVLGSLILVGPFIFTYKLMKSMNLVNGDFNVNG